MMRLLHPIVHGRVEPGPEVVDIHRPGDHQVIHRVSLATESVVRRALDGLAAAFAHTRTMPAYERRNILLRLLQHLERDAETIAQLIANEAGKPIRLARGEVERAKITIACAADEAWRRYGEMMPLDVTPAHRGRWGVWFRVPVGPVLAITPFNFPLNLVLHKIAPAMAIGAPFVIKPSPQTPATAELLTRWILDAGWPPEAIAYLPCANTVAEAMARAPEIKVVSFTGSAQVGWHLKRVATDKRVILEMGGNAHVIVHADADLDWAAERCAFWAFVYAGQVCIAVQIIQVHASVLDAFMERLIAAARALKVGDIFDGDVVIGPMINTPSADRVMAWIEQALHRGARVILEGRREGDWIHPWILTHVPSDLPVYCEEVFGPVVIVEPYTEWDEAVRRINQSVYGLQAGVFTRDWHRIQDAMRRIEVGGLVVNDVPTVRVDPMPYGGMKQSGFGREGVRFAIEEMTDIRMVLFQHM